MPSTLNATTTNGLVTSADNSGSLQLQTNNGTTAVTIDTSQNVGIGTTSPAYKLDVSGGHAQIRGAQALFFGNSANNSLTGIYNAGSSGSSAMAFETPAGTERMRINSDGGVLVNTTAHYSSGRFVSYSASGVNAVFVNDDSTTNAIVTCRGDQATGNQIFIRFATNTNTERGSITYNRGGGVVAYNTTSDYRLKENIVDLPNALATVAKLKPRQFDWKETGNTTTGFIAHELAEVCPEAVTGEKDAVDEEGNPRYQGVDTSFLVATLTAAIQEQQAQIEELKAEVQALKEGKQ